MSNQLGAQAADCLLHLPRIGALGIWLRCCVAQRREPTVEVDLPVAIVAYAVIALGVVLRSEVDDTQAIARAIRKIPAG